MRFLLINPYYPISENPSPPLGLAYLAAALLEAGIDVRILDLVVRPYDRESFAALLADFPPDLIGATAVTMTVDNALSVLADAKALAPNAVTVLGGPHATFRATETLDENPALDIVVLGEGEMTAVELTRAVELGADLAGVPGLAFRQGGGVTVTAPRPPGLDLNRLPKPARHLLPLARYRALGMSISMTTSRGCPFHCIFCVGRKMVGQKVRYRDPELVADEMAELAAYGFPQINVADDLFTANKKHCLAVCDAILRRGLKVKWTSFARVDTVSPEVLARMREAGCTAVSFGVETGNPDILRTIEKGITLAQVEEAAGMCAETGVLPHASFILGLPGETAETIEQTKAFGEHLKNAYGVSYGFHLLAPFPGTKVREENERYGISILTDDWREYHANRAIVETPGAGRELLDATAREWEVKFDEYLGYLKKRIESGEADDEEAWPLVNLERIVLTYDLMMQRTVETVGDWPANTEPALETTDLDRLIDRVAALPVGSAPRLAETLRLALDRGHLTCIRENGSLRWAWADQLPSAVAAP